MWLVTSRGAPKRSALGIPLGVLALILFVFSLLQAKAAMAAHTVPLWRLSLSEILHNLRSENVHLPLMNRWALAAGASLKALCLAHPLHTLLACLAPIAVVLGRCDAQALRVGVFFFLAFWIWPVALNQTSHAMTILLPLVNLGTATFLFGFVRTWIPTSLLTRAAFSLGVVLHVAANVFPLTFHNRPPFDFASSPQEKVRANLASFSFKMAIPYLTHADYTTGVWAEWYWHAEPHFFSPSVRPWPILPIALSRWHNTWPVQLESELRKKHFEKTWVGEEVAFWLPPRKTVPSDFPIIRIEQGRSPPSHQR